MAGDLPLLLELVKKSEHLSLGSLHEILCGHCEHSEVEIKLEV